MSYNNCLEITECLLDVILSNPLQYRFESRDPGFEVDYARSHSELMAETTPLLNIVFKSLMDVFLSGLYLLPLPSCPPPVGNLNST
jgi:hypothetical protein